MIIQNAWHHIRRSPFQSLASILIISVFFFVSTTFVYLSHGLQSVLNYLETKPEITLYLKDGLDKLAIENVQKEISQFDGVREIRFISKEKALEIYRQENQDNPLLVEMVNSSALPASFEVTVSHPSYLTNIADNFQGRKDVIDEIIYQKDLIEQIINWTKNIRLSGIILMSVLGFVSFLVIFVIIGLKITNRKNEISVSRLLGANRLYVQQPFLVEGMFYGFMGSLLGFLSSFGLVYYFHNTINQYFTPIVFIPQNIIFHLSIFLISTLVGLLLSLVSTFFSVQRFIKY